MKSIPLGDSPEERERRDELYSQFDVNGNSYLSLAECDKGIRDVLNLPELFELKPVIMRSFQAAKQKFKAKSPHGDEYISKAEFRFFLIYLRQYYTLWEKFDRVEINGDRKVSVNEFTAGAPYLSRSLGIKINNPSDTFNGLLKKYNATSNITFTDFCDWAIGEHLKLHKDREDHNDL